ncbi:zinc finger CDGSH type [Cooperia oncophora]
MSRNLRLYDFAIKACSLDGQIGYKIAMLRARVNLKVQLSNDKVVDTVDVEDIGEKKAFCRCWKSEKFPYCDGAHTKHNKETGDNVGPLVREKTTEHSRQRVLCMRG